MKVNEFIEYLQTLDQEANVWVMYDPPFSCGRPEVTHLVGREEEYVKMFQGDGVRAGDYAIICW